MVIQANSAIKKLLLVALVITGLYFTRAFLIPLTLGAILATLFLPLCHWLENKKVPRWLAPLLCLLTLLSVLAGIASLVGWQVSELAGDIDEVKDRVNAGLEQVMQYISNTLGISRSKQVKMLQPSTPAVSTLLPMAGSVLNVFTNFVLILVYIFLLLFYRGHIRQFFLRLSQPEHRAETEELVYNTAKVSQQYLAGLAKMIACLWVMYGIGFSIIGVKHAFFFAVLCGLLEVVPFVGNIVGTTLTVLVAAVQGANAGMLAGIVVTYGTVQFIQTWIFEPLIVGPQVKINPLFTILALVAGELIWGVPGIILAIPLTGMVKILCDHIPALKPYGFLIGDIEKKNGERGPFRKLADKILAWRKKRQ